MYLGERKISLSLMMHGQTSISMSLQSLPGVVSGNPRWSTIGSDGWLLSVIVLRSSFSVGLSTDRAAVGRLLPQMSFLMRLSLGLEIRIHGSVPPGRVRHRDEGRFSSAILPRYMRPTPSVDALIPALYLKGISTGDFSEALAAILGEGASGFSATNVVRLKAGWEKDYKVWCRRDLSQKRYVYWWADGVYFNVRLDEERTCVLVLSGATQDGTKELLAVVDGYRETTQSWRELLGQLKRLGLSTHRSWPLAIGSLGFWIALQEEHGPVAQQRCRVHKTANILDKAARAALRVGARYISWISCLALPCTLLGILMSSSFPVTKANSQKLTSAWKKTKKSCLLLRLSGPALATFTHYQPNRVHLCDRPTTNPSNEGLRFTNCDLDYGLQTRPRSPKTLVLAPRLSN